MAIYVEYVIIDNVVMDYIIIKMIELTVGRKFGKWNKILLCCLGSLFALGLPIIMHYKALTFVYKILTSIILVITLKKYKNIKSFLAYYFMFFAYTFFVGGVCLGVIQLLGINYTMSSVMMYEFDFPFGIFGIILLMVINLMMKVVRFAKSKMLTSNYIHKIKLVDSEKSIVGYGFLDSGNNVKFGGKGVSIISVDMFLKLYDNINLQDLILNKNDKINLRDCQYINIEGIGRKQEYLSFLLDYIEIKGKRYESPRFAISFKSFGEYDVILSNEFIGGGL